MGLDANREAYERALCGVLAVPGVGSSRASQLIERFGVLDVLAAIRARERDALAILGSGAASAVEGAVAAEVFGTRAYEYLRRSGDRMWLPGDDRWANFFGDDPRPPAALFVRGNLATLDRARVAIVGTRNASANGRELAQRFGRQLGDAGVAIVSGLAYGIDANAHAGALSSSRPAPVGVVGSGLDVVYPRQHSKLWERVGDYGLLMSEYLPGTEPIPSNFPARNRIIAALCDVLLVVESTESGGSLLTVECAWERHRRVIVVPGSPLNPSAAGTNMLLKRRHAGEFRVDIAVEAADVLSLLALDVVDASHTSTVDIRPQPQGFACDVLRELGWEPRSTGDLVQRLQSHPIAVTSALNELELDGWVARNAGRWQQIAAGGVR